MITVLQRQTVSKRTVPPVADRARSNGVRWTRERDPRSAVPSGHSFLQRQIVRVQKNRAHAREPRFTAPDGQRISARHAGEKRWARIFQKAAAHRGSFRQQVREAPPPRNSRAIRPSLLRVVRSPVFFVTLAAAVALAFAAVSLSGAVLPAVHEVPVLPAPPDGDPALYGLVVPAPAARPATGAPVSLARLQVTQYRAQPGDTLSKISSRFRLNLDTIVSWNGIRDGRGIAAGTVLDLPNADGLKYVVRRGDTLQGIARSWGVDFNGVLDWNRLSSSVIPVGQELFLPGARMNPNELNRILGNLFMYPVQGRISSYFGERADPFTGVPNYHNGIDIVNRPGTPVLAAMAGTVADVGFNYNYGNYVILKHSGQYQTLYGHLTRAIVGRGQKLQQGESLGELGSTGYSTGPHVHFSIFHNGVPVDPLRFLK
jgi:murein DD-endopeptidase MepM/ murein hydrolase activator NlpD